MRCRCRGISLAGAAWAAVGVSALTADAAWAAGPKLNPGDVGQGIAAILIFVLLLLSLRRWAWGPIVTQLRRREENLAAMVDRAEAREAEAAEALAEYKAMLVRAEVQAEEILREAREGAALHREEAVEAARAEAKQSADAVRRDVAQAKREAMTELQEKSAGLATELAGKIVGRTLSEADHRRLVDESLEEIRRRVAEDHG